MKISVITVAFNSETTIAHTITSFLEQRYANREMLIIDGMSTDRTVEIARSFDSDLIRIISEPDGGLYDAMNKGLGIYSGDAVGFLNSDDEFTDCYALGRLAEAFGEADMVYGDIRMVQDGEIKKVVRDWRSGPFSRRKLSLGWVPPHPAFYIRREVARRVGFFDPSYRSAADYDFMVRALALSDFRVRTIGHYLVDFRMGGISTRSLPTILRANWNCLRSRRRNLGAGLVDAAFFLKPAQKILQLR